MAFSSYNPSKILYVRCLCNWLEFLIDVFWLIVALILDEYTDSLRNCFHSKNFSDGKYNREYGVELNYSLPSRYFLVQSQHCKHQNNVLISLTFTIKTPDGHQCRFSGIICKFCPLLIKPDYCIRLQIYSLGDFPKSIKTSKTTYQKLRKFPTNWK